MGLRIKLEKDPNVVTCGRLMNDVASISYSRRKDGMSQSVTWNFDVNWNLYSEYQPINNRRIRCYDDQASVWSSNITWDTYPGLWRPCHGINLLVVLSPISASQQLLLKAIIVKD